MSNHWVDSIQQHQNEQVSLATILQKYNSQDWKKSLKIKKVKVIFSRNQMAQRSFLSLGTIDMFEPTDIHTYMLLSWKNVVHTLRGTSSSQKRVARLSKEDLPWLTTRRCKLRKGWNHWIDWGQSFNTLSMGSRHSEEENSTTFPSLLHSRPIKQRASFFAWNIRHLYRTIRIHQFL